MGDDRAVVLWIPPNERPEGLEEARRKAELAEVRTAEMAARKAAAERREYNARTQIAAAKLVATQLEKMLRLAEHPDYADAPGPIDMKDLIKLAELINKELRLDTGQATEKVAHTIGPSIDFSKLLPSERDEWRRLVAKGGGVSD